MIEQNQHGSPRCRQRKMEKFEIEVKKEGNEKWQEKQFLEIYPTINELFYKSRKTYRITINKIECFFYISLRKGKDEKREREEDTENTEKTGGAAATIAERKTKNEPTINTRRTIEEAFDLVTPANQSLGRLILRCTRSRVPSFALVLPATDQTMTDSGNFRNVHLGKTPFAPK